MAVRAGEGTGGGGGMSAACSARDTRVQLAIISLHNHSGARATTPPTGAMSPRLTFQLGHAKAPLAPKCHAGWPHPGAVHARANR